MTIGTKQLEPKDTREIDKGKTSIVRGGEVQTTWRQTNGRVVVAHRDGLLSFIGPNPFLPPVSNDIVTIPIPTLPTSLPH